MEARIQRNIIILVATTSVIVLGMIIAWTFMLHKPAAAEYARLSTQYETRKGVADSLQSALADQVKAERSRENVKKQIALFRQRYRCVNFDLGADSDSDDVKEAKREKTWRNIMNEYYSDYGLALKQELIDAANESGVIIDTQVKVDAPPQAPEAVSVPANGFLKPTGATPLGVTLTGDFNSILLFLTRINQSNILMIVGNIKIEGTSPYLKCTTTIMPYELASGPSVNLVGTAAAGGPGGPPGPGGPGGAPGAGAPPSGGGDAASPKTSITGSTKAAENDSG